MRVAEILEYAQKHDVRVWADGHLLRVDAPRETMTPEFQDDLKRHKSDLIRTLTGPQKISALDTPVPTAPEPDPEAQAVQDRLRAGERVRVRMGDIGEAYWVATDKQRDQLRITLDDKGDTTPVFSWGELVLIQDWPAADQRNIYGFKRDLGGNVTATDQSWKRRR